MEDAAHSGVGKTGLRPDGHIKPEAFEWLIASSKKGGKGAYQNLKRAIEDNEVEFNHHGARHVDFLTFDWCDGNQDKNWWWRMQALPLLEWYYASFEVQAEGERKEWFSFCLSALKNWEDRSGSGSPLAWHDHASAFRLKNIAVWYLLCSQDLMADDDDREFLVKLLDRHIRWLSRDENYSVNTNHGLDQSMVLYMVCRMFNTDACQENEELAYTRLIHEIVQAFTSEGVHKENSPGYQKYMLERIGSMSSLSPLDGGRVESESKHLIESIKKFLGIITMPNGLLPPIGDTNPEKEGHREELQKGIEVHDYSRSGYVVAKGKTDDGHDLFMVVKNCYLSNYHRHDDDLSIFIYYNGDTVLGDGGIYKYAEKDEKRIFLRSPIAHSIPVIDRKAIRGVDKAAERPVMEVLAGDRIQATSHMFGVEVRRTIDLSDVGKGIIRITDECQKAGDGSIVNFYLTDAQSAMVSNSALVATFQNSTARISSRTGLEDCRVVHGWTGGRPDESAIVSKKYGTVQPCYRMSARLNKLTSYSIELFPE